MEDIIAAGFSKNSSRWALSRCTGFIEEELHCEFKKKTESLRELLEFRDEEESKEGSS